MQACSGTETPWPGSHAGCRRASQYAALFTNFGGDAAAVLGCALLAAIVGGSETVFSRKWSRRIEGGGLLRCGYGGGDRGDDGRVDPGQRGGRCVTAVGGSGEGGIFKRRQLGYFNRESGCDEHVGAPETKGMRELASMRRILKIGMRGYGCWEAAITFGLFGTSRLARNGLGTATCRRETCNIMSAQRGARKQTFTAATNIALTCRGRGFRPA